MATSASILPLVSAATPTGSASAGREKAEGGSDFANLLLAAAATDAQLAAKESNAPTADDIATMTDASALTSAISAETTQRLRNLLADLPAASKTAEATIISEESLAADDVSALIEGIAPAAKKDGGSAPSIGNAAPKPSEDEGTHEAVAPDASDAAAAALAVPSQPALPVTATPEPVEELLPTAQLPGQKNGIESVPPEEASPPKGQTLGAASLADLPNGPPKSTAPATSEQALTGVLTGLASPSPKDDSGTGKTQNAAKTPASAEVAKGEAKAADATRSDPTSGDANPAANTFARAAADQTGNSAHGPSGHQAGPANESSGTPAPTHLNGGQAAASDGTRRGEAQVPVVVVRASHESGSTATLPAAQLAVVITRQLRQGSNQFEIRLDPPELGRIDVRLDVSHQGRVMATLSADRQETLDLLQRDARALQRALNEAGLETNADSLNFTMRDQTGRHQQPDDGWSPPAPTSSNDNQASADTTAKAYTASWEPGRLDVRV